MDNEELDFQWSIPWGNWVTNAWGQQADFFDEMAKAHSPRARFPVYPVFKFTMSCRVRDDLSAWLNELYEECISIKITNGPLGGGTFYVFGKPLDNAEYPHLEYEFALTGPAYCDKAMRRV